MKKIRFWLPPFLWAIVIFVFSSFPVQPSSQIYWQDFAVKKTAHLIEYGLLFLLIYRALINTTGLGKKDATFLSFLLVVIYGSFDEYHQSFTPGRKPNLYDVAFDGLGGIIVWFGIWRYLPKAPKPLKSLAKALQVN